MRVAGAAALLGASATLFGVMAFLSKLATRSYDGASVAAFRFAFGAVAAGLIMLLGMERRMPRRPGLIALRAVLGAVAVLLYFLAIERLSVGLATLLNYTSPVFTVLLSRIFLGERLHLAGLGGLALASTGVWLVVTGQQTGADTAPPDPLWVGLALLSAVGSAGAITCIRALRRGGAPESIWSIFLVFCLFGVVCTVPFGHTWRAPSGAELVLLLSIGATAMVAQLAMNGVMRWVPAALFGISAQLAVVTAMVLGVLLLDEPWTARSALGAALTLAGVGWAGWPTR